MPESLKNKTVKGVGWSFVDNIANSGITFLVGLVLARLLTPAEYGIMAMITIFIAISTSIVDSGFSNALIRKQDAGRVDYSTVFFFNLGVSAVLYAVLYVGAPGIAAFFKEPLLRDVMRVIGWVLIINALAIIPRTLFVKAVNFKTQTKVSLIASLSSGAVGIGMALGGMGVWSLVGQQLSRQLMNTVFLWVYGKWRPSLEFSVRSFRELFGFGSKLLLSGLLSTVFQEIYALVIGRFYTSAQLGQYTRAQQFNTIFSSNLTAVVQRVSYPVLSSKFNKMDPALDYLLYGNIGGKVDPDEMKLTGERKGKFPRQLATTDYMIQDPRYLQAYANYFCKFIASSGCSQAASSPRSLPTS